MNQSQIERLDKLAQLRASGTLTDEEFASEKAKVLKRSPPWPLYAGAGGLALAVAVAIGTWSVSSPTPVEKPQRRVAASPAPTSSISPAAIPTVRSPGQELDEAFRAATGRSKAFTQTVDGESVTTTPIRFIELPFGRALLTKREIKNGCHACPGYLGVYYLADRDGAITVARRFDEAVSGWAWGSAPEFEMSNRFTSFPAIYATGGDMHQGYAENGATLTELTPNGPVQSDYIALGSSNEGAITDEPTEQVCTVDGKIANIMRDKSFDVVMNGSASHTTRYVKRAGKFVAATKGSSTC